jgi:streptogramin lyase
VADTGNHAIRRIDLATGEVRTIAGTGTRGRALGAAGDAARTALASPWDLLPYGGGLLFANAGTHQLGALDPATGEVERLAGAGGENLRDGPAAEALLAQPSGLSVHGDSLFFVDSETSSVRQLDLATMTVSTLVGTGLFDFGHRNGSFAEARLQHPLGLASLPDGNLLVADSYNGVVRVLDMESRTVRDLDDGFTCHDKLCLPPGGEPAGVAVDPHAPADDPRILCVETNRHRIVEIRPARREYRTWAG